MFSYFTSGAAKISHQGDILGGRPRMGSGGGLHERQKILKKIPIVFSRKLQKRIILGDFSKRLKTPS